MSLTFTVRTAIWMQSHHNHQYYLILISFSLLLISFRVCLLLKAYSVDSLIENVLFPLSLSLSLSLFSSFSEPPPPTHSYTIFLYSPLSISFSYLSLFLSEFFPPYSTLSLILFFFSFSLCPSFSHLPRSSVISLAISFSSSSYV